MAKCVIITDENNKVEAILAPNGQISILFQDILNLENISNKEDALKTWAQVYTPAFEIWFKDSAVIDENGEPLLVYRKPNESIASFNWTTEKQEGQVPFLISIKNLEETTLDLINLPDRLSRTNGGYITQNNNVTELLTFDENDSFAIIDTSLTSATSSPYISKIETVTEGDFGFNREQMLSLLGHSMYNKPIAQVSLKELLQNSFDGVKSMQNRQKKDNENNVGKILNLKYKVGKIHNTEGKEIFAGIVNGEIYINKDLIDKYTNKEILTNQKPILNTILKNLDVYDKLVNLPKEQFINFLVAHENAHLLFEKEGRKFKTEDIEEAYANARALLDIGILELIEFDLSKTDQVVSKLKEYFPTREQYINDITELVAKEMDNAYVHLSSIGTTSRKFEGSLWGQKLDTSSMDQWYFLQDQNYPKNKKELKERISDDIHRNVPQTIKEKYWKDILESLPDDEKALLSNWAYYNDYKRYTRQYGKPTFEFNEMSYPELYKKGEKKYTKWTSFISGLFTSFDAAGEDLWFANPLLSDTEDSIINWYKNLTPEKLDEYISNLSRVMAFKSMVVASFTGSSISALDKDAREIESLKKAYYNIKNRTKISSIKIKTNISESKLKTGLIRISINNDDRTISIRDNGIGMTEEVLKSAFLQVGGTEKKGLDVEDRSGGFGLAKVQFLLGSEEIFVETVSDGVKTTVDTTNKGLMDNVFKVKTKSTEEKNGTYVRLKIPKSYTTLEGVVKSISFPGKYLGWKEFDILTKPLIGNVDVKIKHTINGTSSVDVVPIGVNSTLETLPPLFTKIKFEWGEADLYISEEKIENRVDIEHLVLSSGIYQFNHRYIDKDFNIIPYNIVLNIKSNVRAESHQYPFNNTREGFKNTVKQDMNSLATYIEDYSRGLSNEEAKEVFSDLKSLPKIDPNKILTEEESKSIYDNYLKITEAVNKQQQAREKQKEKRRKVSLRIANDKIFVKEIDDHEQRIKREEGSIQEKEWSSTFKAEKKLNASSSSVKTSFFDDTYSQFHNNTNINFLKDPKAVEFFAELGSVILDFVRFAGNELEYNYQKLKGGPDKKFFAGISIDKSYGGVHIRRILDAIFINPLAVPYYNLSFGYTNWILGIMIHEINHTTVSGEGARFTSELEALRGSLYDTGKMPFYESAINKIISKHLTTYKNLRNEFNKSTTKNISKSLEGESIKRTTTRNISSNADDVQTGQFANERSQGDRQNFENDKTGEIIDSFLKDGNINEKTSIVAESILNGTRVINIDMSSQKNEIANETVDELNNELNRLVDKFGVISTIVSHDEAVLLTENSYNPYTGQSSSFFYNGKIYFVNDLLSTNQILHEFSHPFISAIRKSNPKLYNKLIQDALNTEEGIQALKEAKKEYEGVLEEFSYAINDEILVKLLTQAAIKDKTKIDNKKFDSIIQRIIYAIKQVLKDLFGKTIKIQDLSVDTTILDLAKMMNSTDKIDINTELISEKDIVQYLQDISEERKELNKLPFKEVSNIINQEYDIVSNHVREMMKEDDLDGLQLLLNPKEGGGIYLDIQERIQQFQTIQEFRENENDILNSLDHQKQTIDSVIYNLQKLNKAVTIIKDNLEKIKKEPNNKENLIEASKNWLFLKNWEFHMNYIHTQLSTYGVNSDSKLIQLVSNTQSTIKVAEISVNNMFESGSVDFLHETWETVNNRLTEIWDERRKYLIKNKAKLSQINQERKVYEESLIDKTKMKKFLKGEYGDSSSMFGFIEGYMFSGDPIIGSFGLWMRNNMHDVMDDAIKRSVEMSTILKPLLKKAGYNQYNPTAFWRNYVFEDSTTGERNADGILTDEKVYTFLNELQNWRYFLTNERDKLDILHAEYLDNGSKDSDYLELVKATKNFNKHSRIFFNQPFVDEYYEAYELFETSVGALAKNLYDSKRKEISDLKDKIGDGKYDIYEYNLDNISLKQLNRELRLLSSEYGKDELGVEVAKILKTFKKKQSKFKESLDIPNSFDNAYNNFKTLLNQKLIDEGYNQKEKQKEYDNEFEKRLEEWLEQNTSKKIDQKWWDLRKKLFDQLAILTSNLPINDTFKIDDNLKRDFPVLYDYVTSNDIEDGSYSYGEYIKNLYEKLNDIMSPYKDSNGIVEGGDLSIKHLKRIGEIQEEIKDLREELAGSTGLTKLETAEMNGFWEEINIHKKNKKFVNPKFVLSERDYEKFVKYNAKKSTLGLNKLQKDSLNKIFELLEELQTKKVTIYYLDQLNEILSNEELIPVLHSVVGFENGEINESNVTDLLANSVLIDKLLVNEGFKEWFEISHFENIYNDEGVEVISYTPIAAWLQIIPVDDEYYLKTNIYNEKNEKERTISAVPSFEYKKTFVKKEYVTKKDNTTWSESTGWLPKNYNQMQEIASKNPALEDPYRYINMEYIKLKNSKGPKYELLEKVKELHLENQVKLHRRSRLENDIARFRKTPQDLIQGVGHDGLSSMVEEIGSRWMARKDDQEEQFSAIDQKILLSMDMFDDDKSKIPIRGKYDLNIRDVSLDVLYGLDRYSQAAIKQRKLIKLSPYARALEKTLGLESNIPDETESVFDKAGNLKIARSVKSIFSSSSKRYDKKGKKNSRFEHISHYVKREFEGKLFGDSKQNTPWLVKGVSNLAKMASFTFFQSNLTSALKNRYGAIFQALNISIGGKYFNPKDMVIGRFWSAKTQSILSFGGHLYTSGSKPVEIMMMDHFEAVPGYSADKITTRHSRTMLTDITSGSWVYSPRKFLEIGATLQQFGALMNNIKVPKIDDNGKIIKINGLKQTVPYLNAFEVVDDKLQLKKGLDPSYNIGGVKFKEMKNRIRTVIMKLQGAYSLEDQPYGNQYFLFRMAMFMRKYFPPMMIAERYAGIGKFEDPQHLTGKSWAGRYEPGTGEVVLGRHLWAFRSLFGSLRYKNPEGLKRSGFIGKTLDLVTFKVHVFDYQMKMIQGMLGSNEFKLLPVEQKRAVNKTVMEFFMLWGISAALFYLFGFDPDDEERWNKMKERSGPLPGPLVDSERFEDRPFNMWGWSQNHMILLLMNIRAENEQFIPLPGYGLSDLSHMRDNLFIVLNPTLDNLVKMSMNIDGSKDDYYKKDAGPYIWQTGDKEDFEGSWKGYNIIGKMFGFNGQFVDPATGAQKFSTYRQQARKK